MLKINPGGGMLLHAVTSTMCEKIISRVLRVPTYLERFNRLKPHLSAL